MSDTCSSACWILLTVTCTLPYGVTTLSWGTRPVKLVAVELPEAGGFSDQCPAEDNRSKKNRIAEGDSHENQVDSAEFCGSAVLGSQGTEILLAVSCVTGTLDYQMNR